MLRARYSETSAGQRIKGILQMKGIMTVNRNFSEFGDSVLGTGYKDIRHALILQGLTV